MVLIFFLLSFVISLLPRGDGAAAHRRGGRGSICRDFAKAAALLLEAVATFSCTELVDFKPTPRHHRGFVWEMMPCGPLGPKDMTCHMTEGIAGGNQKAESEKNVCGEEWRSAPWKDQVLAEAE